MASPADDVALILRLDSAWNEAYRRHDRAPLADILADDFTGFTATGEPVTKAALMIDPPARARSVVFTEPSARCSATRPSAADAFNSSSTTAASISASYACSPSARGSGGRCRWWSRRSFCRPPESGAASRQCVKTALPPPSR